MTPRPLAHSHSNDDDGALMRRYLELSGNPELNAAELAALDAAIQARLMAAYGAAEPGTSPRVRVATS